MPNDNRGEKPGLFDRVDRRGTRFFTLVAIGVVFVVLALLTLIRGGLPGPEKEKGHVTGTDPKVERLPALPTAPTQQ
jgi:hypothetical protein